MLYEAVLATIGSANLLSHPLKAVPFDLAAKCPVLSIMIQSWQECCKKCCLLFFNTLCIVYLCWLLCVMCAVAPAARVELCHFPSASQWAQWIFIPTTLASGNQLHTTTPPSHPQPSSISERKTVYFQLFKWLSFLKSMIFLKVFVALM